MGSGKSVPRATKTVEGPVNMFGPNVSISISGGKKVLVGIYKTDVEDWYIEYYNGGIMWKGNSDNPVL